MKNHPRRSDAPGPVHRQETNYFNSNTLTVVEHLSQPHYYGSVAGPTPAARTVQCVEIAIQLSLPLDTAFAVNGTVCSVEQGSQLNGLVGPGDRVAASGGYPLWSVGALEHEMAAAREQGASVLRVSFQQANG